MGCRSIGRTADSGSANQGSSPCSPANALFLRPHRLAGPGQRPFTPSTGVQIPLGTPEISTGYRAFFLSGFCVLQTRGYNSSRVPFLRNFFFQQVTHDLSNPAAAESRNDPFLIRIQPGAFYISVGCRRPVVPISIWAAFRPSSINAMAALLCRMAWKPNGLTPALSHRSRIKCLRC